MRLSSAMLACLACLTWPTVAQGQTADRVAAGRTEPTLLIATARALVETRDLERARIVLDEAIRVAPASPQARHERGRLLVLSGRLQAGIDELLVAHHLLSVRGRLHFERYTLRLADDDQVEAQAELAAYVDLVNAGAVIIADLRHGDALAAAAMTAPTLLPERRRPTSVLSADDAKASTALRRLAP